LFSGKLAEPTTIVSEAAGEELPPLLSGSLPPPPQAARARVATDATAARMTLVRVMWAVSC